MGIIKHYSLEVTDIFIFDYFLINQIREGTNVDFPHDEQLNEIIENHFENKQMVYISNRVFSYSVNPLIYPKIENITKMIGIALVPESDLMKKNAKYERNFYDKPFEIFGSLLEAINWTEKILSAKTKESKPH